MPTTIICPHCSEEIDDLSFACNYTEWGREYGSADFDFDAISWDDRESSDGDSENYEYSCPKCEHEITKEEVDAIDENEEPAIVKAPPILNQDSPLSQEISSYSSMQTTECSECKAKFEVESNEKDCCCPICSHEFTRD